MIDSASKGRGRAIAEAGVLLALCLTPIWMNPFSWCTFEPDKAMVVRLLGSGVLFGLVGWCAGACRRGARPTRRLSVADAPLLLFSLLFVVQLLSTLFTIQVTDSLWGAVKRGQGVITETVQWVLCLGAALAASSRLSRARMLSAAELGALGVIVYQFWQVYFQPEADERLASFLGNPIFAGDYLVVLLPLLTASFWIDSQRRGTWSIPRLMLLIGAGVALWQTGSRGPLTAAAAVVGIGALLLLGRLGRHRLARGISVIGLVALVFGSVVFVSWAGNDDATDHPRGMTLRVRLWAQQSVHQTMAARKALALPDGLRDSYAAMRLWVGYGPQNVSVVSERSFKPALERSENEGVVIDSAHNRLVDLFAETGIIGLCVYAAFVVVVLLGLLRWGFGGACGVVWLRLLLMLFAAVAGVVGFGVALGTWSWALGALVGWLSGFLLCTALLPHQSLAPLDEKQMMTGGAGVAVLGAILVLQFSVATVTVATIMAVCVGVWSGCGGKEAQAGADVEQTAEPGRAVDRWVTPFLALSVMLMLTWQFGAASAFGGSRGDSRLEAGILPLLLCSGVLVIWSVWASNHFGFPRKRTLLLFWGLMAFLVIALFGFVWIMADESLISAGRDAELSQRLMQLLWVRGAFVVALFGGGVFMVVPRQRRGRPDPVLMGAAVSLLLSLFCLVPRVTADQKIKLALGLKAGGAPRRASALALGALGTAAWDASYLSELHLMQAACAGRDVRASEQDRAMQAACNSMRRAIALSPFEARLYSRLGSCRQVWAGKLSRRARSRAVRLAEAALKDFDRARALAPGRLSVCVKRARLQLAYLGQREAAKTSLLAALERDPLHAGAAELLAIFFNEEARRSSDPLKRRQNQGQCAVFAEKALKAVEVTKRQAVNQGLMKRFLKAYGDLRRGPS